MNKIQNGFTIPVLDHGYVRYIDHMGDDKRILEAARISYKSPSKGDEADKKLLSYLWKNKHCYHPDMEVLTIEGWKQWKNCSEYENYLIPNPDNKTLSVEKLKLLSFSVQDEELEGFTNSRMSYLVTSNHKMWFKTKQNFRLNNDNYKLINADKVHNWGHFECGVHYSLNKSDNLDNYFKLIGFYLGDGFLSSTRKISFRLVKNRKIIYLENILNALNIPYLKKNVKTLTSSGNQIYQYIIERQFFNKAEKYIDLTKKANDKFFDEKQLINLSSEQKLGLLDGLINSDGSIKKDRPQIEFSSTSARLSKLVETLASYFNYDCHHVQEFNNGNNIKIYSENSRTSLEARKQYFYTQKYTGKVFCTTSSTGLLLVRGASNEFSFICGNSSPFEMCKLTLNIKMPIFIMRQYVRHRMQNLNEVSARYTELPNEFYIPKEWRKQDIKNKQGSILTQDFNQKNAILPYNDGKEDKYGNRGIQLSGTLNEAFTDSLTRSCEQAYKTYQMMIATGVSREMARIVLPVNIYTEIYCCWDLKNLLHFINLRSDGHAQSEIQDYSNAIGSIVEQLFPWTWEAFNKYKFQLVEKTSIT